MFEQPEAPAREGQKVSRKITRSLAVDPKGKRGSAVDDAVFWLIPWRFYEFPGLQRGITELTGVSWATVRDYRNGRRRVTARTAKIFADAIESRIEAGLLIVAELRHIERTYVPGTLQPRGWRVVRERDGEIRDGRPKSRKRKRVEIAAEPAVKRPRGRPRKVRPDNPADST